MLYSNRQHSLQRGVIRVATKVVLVVSKETAGSQRLWTHLKRHRYLVEIVVANDATLQHILNFQPDIVVIFNSVSSSFARMLIEMLRGDANSRAIPVVSLVPLDNQGLVIPDDNLRAYEVRLFIEQILDQSEPSQN